MKTQIFETGALTVREHFDKEAAEHGGQTFDQKVEAAQNREVFAADEIPFEVALEVVKRRMTEEVVKLSGLDSISFQAKRNGDWDQKEKGAAEYQWRIYTHCNFVYAPTLEDAKLKIQSPQEIAKAKLESKKYELKRIADDIRQLKKEAR